MDLSITLGHQTNGPWVACVGLIRSMVVIDRYKSHRITSQEISEASEYGVYRIYAIESPKASVLSCGCAMKSREENGESFHRGSQAMALVKNQKI